MYVSADAMGLEWRMALEFSNDQVGINEVLNGEDTHEKNRVAFDLPERRVAKFFLFRVIFRGTPHGFARDPDFSHVSTDPNYWQKVIDKFYAKYHQLDHKHVRWVDECERTGRITAFTGRHWPFRMVERIEPDGSIRRKWDLKQITNKPIQGTGNDFLAIARVGVKKDLTNVKFRAKIVNTVHDSIVVDCEDSATDEVGIILKRNFDNLPNEIKRRFNHELHLPFPCECKVGPNLRDMKPL